jgi:carbamoyltransferase
LTIILGISAYYHDSAAALLIDDTIVAAAQEERFSRKKNDPRFPVNAINYCLEEAFIESDEIDAVAFYDNPVLTIDRVIKNFVAVSPRGRDAWGGALRSLFGSKMQLVKDLQNALGTHRPLLFSDHHMAHAASAYYPSPFDESAILTIDGVGEWATTSLGKGTPDGVTLSDEIRYPHSLGLLYSALTYHCGFKVNSGEYKLMGLAPYGKPIYAKQIREHLVEVKDDGSFRLNLEHFGYLDDHRMTNESFEHLFGGPARKPESRLAAREMDLAASIQEVTEEIVLRLAHTACKKAGTKNLVMAGGVALNCVANGKILSNGICENLWIQPAAGDAGGALGAALLAAHVEYEVPRAARKDGRDTQQGSLLGPRYSGGEVVAALERKGVVYEEVPDPTDRAEQIANALAEGKVVAHFAGRMEFGPRALGARSFLADPRSADAQQRVNLSIKFRDSIRPLAPCVLPEFATEYFDLKGTSPYMLIVAPVNERHRVASNGTTAREGDEDLLRMVSEIRSDIPAVTHVDYSARVQTVDERDNPELNRILKAFHQRTGCPVLVNTSFNVRGEPIVCTPADAVRCFLATDADVLAVENFLIWREKQSEEIKQRDNSWIDGYELD